MAELWRASEASSTGIKNPMQWYAGYALTARGLSIEKRSGMCGGRNEEFVQFGRILDEMSSKQVCSIFLLVHAWA